MRPKEMAPHGGKVYNAPLLSPCLEGGVTNALFQCTASYDFLLPKPKGEKKHYKYI